jgi:hypothetical protein
MYHLIVTFDPRCVMQMGVKHRMGAWRVIECVPAATDRQLIYTDGRTLVMKSPRRLRRGDLCNPRKVLAEYWRALGEVIYFGKAAHG